MFGMVYPSVVQEMHKIKYLCLLNKKNVSDQTVPDVRQTVPRTLHRGAARQLLARVARFRARRSITAVVVLCPRTLLEAYDIYPERRPAATCTTITPL